MRILIVSLFIVGTLGAITIENGQPKVTTTYGTIYGNIKNLPSGKSVYTFEGVPFAKPPVGNLRFEKSEAPDNFGTINATTQHVPCKQFIGVKPPGTDSEDCLYMNIAAPNFTSPYGHKFPVMVFIFGGGFVSGNGNAQFCEDFFERFVTRGIVYVSFHYRIGPLGFYSTGDSTAPGNYGLWDQIQALRFVQDVIQEFNGNKNKVTIFGTSAGGSSTSWLTHSTHLNGIAKQAIPYCGSSRSIWARTNHTVTHSQQLNAALGCDTAANPKECLKTKTLDDIMDAGRVPWIFMPDQLDDGWWSPRVDDDLIQGDNLYTALSNAPKIPTLYGMNSFEEIAFTMNKGMLSPNATHYPVQQANGASFGESDLEAGLQFLLSQGNHYTNQTEAIQKIINFYKNESNQYTVNKWLQTYVQFFQDVHFGLGAVREARFKAGFNINAYFYLHDLRFPNYAFDNELLPVGTTHCQENPYIFGNWSGIEPPREGVYLDTMEKFVNMWISFVKYGIPFYSGSPLIATGMTNGVPYLHIKENSTFEEDLWGNRYDFWSQILQDHQYDWITGYPTDTS